MKKQMPILLMLCCALFCGVRAEAQSSVGLIAHWDMNGSANDVSGNGHNGNAQNVTPAMGSDGVMGDAYYFNGVNSYISIPYSPALNVTNYSVCAVVKVMGFYSGTCHTNIIFNRGTTGSTGTGAYELYFSDAPAGVTCTTPYDTLADCFLSGACASGASLSPASMSSFNYTPHIVENEWYKVVATFNDTVYKIYVNGVLMNSAYIMTPGTLMGASLDSASIGYSTHDAPIGYSDAFKGVIDDIKIYNRAITDSEVAHLGDTCGMITAQPVDTNVAIGGNISYTVSTTISGAVYQWQQDGGTGYVNLTNSGPYSGVSTNVLTISGVTSAVVGDHYRCLVSNTWGCSDTSAQTLLTIGSTGVNDLNVSDYILVYPNPASNNVTVSLPGAAANSAFRLTDATGRTLINDRLFDKTSGIDISGLSSGIYFLAIQYEGHTVYKKIIKG